VKKLGGRASWRAVVPASPGPERLGGSLALPVSSNFFTGPGLSQALAVAGLSGGTGSARCRFARVSSVVSDRWRSERDVTSPVQSQGPVKVS
jgi:hypothetical protein